jgi:hypothetical protein
LLNLFLGFGPLVGDLRWLGREDFASAPAEMLQAAAAQNGVQPGTDCLRIAQFVEAFQRDQERFMHRVFGFWGVAEQPKCRRVQARTVAFQQQTETAAVAATGSNQQLGVRRSSLPVSWIHTQSSPHFADFGVA